MQEFIIQPTSGLCNRIRTIFPFLEYCKLNGRILVVYWKLDSFCNGLFDDILLRPQHMTVVYDAPKIINFIGGNKPLWLNTTNNYLDDLYPIDSIQDIIKKLNNQYQHYNAIHIRRTDHIRLAHRVNQYTPIEYFIDIIEKSILPVYLATDCKHTQKLLLEKFPNKILFYELISGNRLRQTSISHAVIDFFMCVYANNFYGTKYSSFSDMINVKRQSVNLIFDKLFN